MEEQKKRDDEEKQRELEEEQERQIRELNARNPQQQQQEGMMNRGIDRSALPKRNPGRVRERQNNSRLIVFFLDWNDSYAW